MGLKFSDYITNQNDWNDETTLQPWYDRVLLPFNQWETGSDLIVLKKEQKVMFLYKNIEVAKDHTQ